MDVANLLLRITGDNNDAKRALREVAAEAQRYAESEYQAQIKVGGIAKAKEEISSLERSLTLIGQRDVTARIRVKVDRDRNALSLLKAELEHALSGGAGARPLEHIFADISKVGASVAATATQIGGLGAKVAEFFGTLGEGAVGLAGKLGGALLGSIVQIIAQMLLWAVALAVLIPLVSALAGVLVGLIGSLGAAAAGFGVLLLAMGGALLPVILVMVAAFTRLFGIIKAVGTQQKDQQTLAEANANAQRTLTEAYKAQRDAVDQLNSAENAKKEADLGIPDAQLRLDRARKALKDLKGEAADAGGLFNELFKRFEDGDFRPDKKQLAKLGDTPATSDSELDLKGALLELAHAQLGVKEAKDGAVAATHRLQDAQARENEFVRKGVLAYEPYVQALKQVSAAKKQLTEDTGKYSAKELALGSEIKRVFDQIQQTFAGISQPVFDGILSFLKDLQAFFGNDDVKDGLGDVGDAVGYVFKQFGRLLQRQDVRELFADLTRDGAQLAKIIGGRVFTDLAVIFLRIADRAAPALIDLFDAFADWLDSIANEKPTKRFNDRIDGLVHSFRIWLRVAKDLSLLILSFFGAGKKDGDEMAESIDKQLVKWRKIIDQEGGREKIIAWIRRSKDYINNDLIPALNNAFKILKDIAAVGNTVGNIFDVIAHPRGERTQHLLGRTTDRDREESTRLLREGTDDYESAESRVGVVPNDVRLARAQRALDKIIASYKKSGKGTINLPKNLEDFLAQLGLRPIPGLKYRRAWGGPLPGVGGFGDSIDWQGEGGEFVIRRSIAQSLGRPALDAVNSGASLAAAAAMSGGGGGGWHVDNINLPPSPPAERVNPRYVTSQIGQMLENRGKG